MKSNRTSSMQKTLGGNVCGPRFLGGGESPERYCSTVNPNVSGVLLPLLVVDSAKRESRCTATSAQPLILGVCDSRNVPEVVNAVVAPISVPVVNFVLRQFAMDVEPCEVMRQEFNLADADNSVAMRIDPPGDFTGARTAFCPHKNTGFRVVCKRLTQFRLRHVIAPTERRENLSRLFVFGFVALQPSPNRRPRNLKQLCQRRYGPSVLTQRLNQAAAGSPLNDSSAAGIVSRDGRKRWAPMLERFSVYFHWVNCKRLGNVPLARCADSVVAPNSTLAQAGDGGA